jgi:hypothetical protein
MLVCWLVPCFDFLTCRWNVYDAFNVNLKYGVGDRMPPLNASTYKDVQSLAYWLELNKASSALSGNLLGGALLADVLAQLQAAVDATSSSSGLGTDSGNQVGILHAPPVKIVSNPCYYIAWIY